MRMVGPWFANFAAATMTLVTVTAARADRPSRPVKAAVVAPAATPIGVDRPASAHAAVAAIDDRVKDIESLRQQAARDGQGTRLSCIDDKLRKAKQAREEAAQLVGDTAISQIAFDQILLRQVYAIVYAEEARACADLKPSGTGGVVPPKSTTPTTPDIPNPVTDVPVVIRPPLASTY